MARKKRAQSSRRRRRNRRRPKNPSTLSKPEEKFEREIIAYTYVISSRSKHSHDT